MQCEWHAKQSFIPAPIAVFGAENSMPYIGLNVEWELDKSYVIKKTTSTIHYVSKKCNFCARMRCE